MKHLLQIGLVLGAIIGLFGQGLALAYAPAPARASARMAMAGDCMSDMTAARPMDAGKTCKGLTFACIAAMGCTVPLVVPTGHDVAAPAASSAPVHGRGASPYLAGRALVPEPEPPSIG